MSILKQGQAWPLGEFSKNLEDNTTLDVFRFMEGATASTGCPQVIPKGAEAHGALLPLAYASLRRLALFNAQYLFGADSVYSPWMSREGDSLRFTVDVIAVNAATSGGIDVEIWTKNSEDPGNGLQADTDAKITVTSGPNIAVAESKDDLKELVRYKFTGKGTGADYVLFRMLSPVWFNNVDA